MTPLEAAADLRAAIAAAGVYGAIVEVRERGRGPVLIARMPIPKRIQGLARVHGGYRWQGIHVLVSTKYGIAEKRTAGISVVGVVNASYDGMLWSMATDTVRWLRHGALYAKAVQRGPQCWRLTIEYRGKVASRLVRDLNVAKLRVALVLRALSAENLKGPCP